MVKPEQLIKLRRITLIVFHLGQMAQVPLQKTLTAPTDIDQIVGNIASDTSLLSSKGHRRCMHRIERPGQLTNLVSVVSKGRTDIASIGGRTSLNTGHGLGQFVISGVASRIRKRLNGPTN